MAALYKLSIIYQLLESLNLSLIISGFPGYLENAIFSSRRHYYKMIFVEIEGQYSDLFFVESYYIISAKHYVNIELPWEAVVS